MKFLLHIGSPKAGSSYLQSACARSRQALRSQGIFFPAGAADDEARMLAGRISGGNARVLANTIWQQRWDAVEQTLSQAADSARSQGCERVLLSSEWLLGALANDGQLSQLASRIARLNAGSVELFLLLRDPVEQLVSHYRHRAKSGRAGSLR